MRDAGDGLSRPHFFEARSPERQHPGFSGLLECLFCVGDGDFSFVAALLAREHLQSLEGQFAVKKIPAAEARFNCPVKSRKIGA